MAYEIGTTEAGMTALSALPVPVGDPKSKEHFERYALYRLAGDGRKKGYGLPRTKWEWGFITQEERDQLKTFFPLESNTVFIKTRLPDDSFATYEAIGNWIEQEGNFGGGYVKNLVIEFTFMEAL